MFLVDEKGRMLSLTIDEAMCVLYNLVRIPPSTLAMALLSLRCDLDIHHILDMRCSDVDHRCGFIAVKDAKSGQLERVWQNWTGA